MTSSKWLSVMFWASTILFAVQMIFTAYAQLRLPQVATEFARLGFPAYFRVELSCAKLAGVLALIVPIVSARVKEWAYAGFTITLVSAVIAHLAVGEGIEAWGWAAATGVMLALSYMSWRRLQSSSVAHSKTTSELWSNA